MWLPANITWTTGGAGVALLPVPYPGSERSADSSIRMARKTLWEDRDGWSLGQGQRLFATDADDFPILQVRRIVLDNPVIGDGAAPDESRKDA